MLFIFDENYPPGFVEGFAIIDKSDKRNPITSTIVHSSNFMGTSGYSDEEIITKASQQNAVIITQDSDFKKIKHHKTLLMEHKVGFIYFRTVNKKNSYWDVVRAFISKWEDIKKQISTAQHPFAFEINKHGHLALLPF